MPYPPGGGTDYFARLVGGAMGEALGQSVIVENRAGAATIIGAEAVAHAAPDGYTILLGDTATFAANKSLYQKLPYDPQRDFSPVTLTGRFAIVLLVNTNKLKVGSLQELIEAARRAPGTIDYASPGVGSPFHLATELLASAAGIKLNHVPYRGVAPALQDLAAGQMGMMFVDFASARSQLATPGIKAFAVASLAPLPGLPGVPTIAASGFAGFEAWAWQGFVVPAGTPADIVGKINASYRATVRRRTSSPSSTARVSKCCRAPRRICGLYAKRNREVGTGGQGREYPRGLSEGAGGCHVHGSESEITVPAAAIGKPSGCRPTPASSSMIAKAAAPAETEAWPTVACLFLRYRLARRSRLASSADAHRLGTGMRRRRAWSV